MYRAKHKSSYAEPTYLPVLNDDQQRLYSRKMTYPSAKDQNYLAAASRFDNMTRAKNPFTIPPEMRPALSPRRIAKVTMKANRKHKSVGGALRKAKHMKYIKRAGLKAYYRQARKRLPKSHRKAFRKHIVHLIKRKPKKLSKFTAWPIESILAKLDNKVYKRRQKKSKAAKVNVLVPPMYQPNPMIAMNPTMPNPMISMNPTMPIRPSIELIEPAIVPSIHDNKPKMERRLGHLMAKESPSKAEEDEMEELYNRLSASPTAELALYEPATDEQSIIQRKLRRNVMHGKDLFGQISPQTSIASPTSSLESDALERGNELLKLYKAEELAEEPISLKVVDPLLQASTIDVEKFVPHIIEKAEGEGIHIKMPGSIEKLVHVARPILHAFAKKHGVPKLHFNTILKHPHLKRPITAGFMGAIASILKSPIVRKIATKAAQVVLPKAIKFIKGMAHQGIDQLSGVAEQKLSSYAAPKAAEPKPAEPKAGEPVAAAPGSGAGIARLSGMGIGPNTADAYAFGGRYATHVFRMAKN